VPQFLVITEANSNKVYYILNLCFMFTIFLQVVFVLLLFNYGTLLQDLCCTSIMLNYNLFKIGDSKYCCSVYVVLKCNLTLW
jgi:hypothetical protein